MGWFLIRGNYYPIVSFPWNLINYISKKSFDTRKIICILWQYYTLNDSIFVRVLKGTLVLTNEEEMLSCSVFYLCEKLYILQGEYLVAHAGVVRQQVSCEEFQTSGLRRKVWLQHFWKPKPFSNILKREFGYDLIIISWSFY